MAGIAAVVLAAGGSTRFGKPKQLVRVNDQALVRRTASVALQAQCSPVIIVAGAAAETIGAQLDGLEVEIVHNANWQEGLGSSIRTGMENLREADAVILLACDQPLVRPETLRGLIELHQTSGKPIVAASYAETLGIPALFDRSCFEELLTLSGDRGAKGIILSQPGRVAAYDFPEGAIDIDTPSDLENYFLPKNFRND
jgi:molybdenum cofactor cytidylyltransferase